MSNPVTCHLVGATALICSHVQFWEKQNKKAFMCLCSLVNELALTARKMYADEAKSSGLVR